MKFWNLRKISYLIVTILSLDIWVKNSLADTKGLLSGKPVEGEESGPDIDELADLNSNSTGETLKGRGSRGLRGFLPGFKLGGAGGGGAGGGGGLFGKLKGGGGKGLFGKLGLGKAVGGGNKGFPDFPSENLGHGGGGGGGGNNDGASGGYASPPGSSYGAPGDSMGSTAGNGWSSSDGGGGGGSSGSKGFLGGLFKNPFGGGGGGGLLKNVFGGGGKGGKGGGSPFRILSRLNTDQPCAAGLGSLPILNKIPFIPKARFPRFVPSGVNTCDATCGGKGEWRRVPPTKEEEDAMKDKDKDANGCTYNWRDSFTSFPFLLFRCSCQGKCPTKKVSIGGPFNSNCENVSDKKTRCKCPFGQETYKCTLTALPFMVPLINRAKPYYCTCCDEEASGGYGLGGYGGGGGSTSSYGVPQGPVLGESDIASSSNVFGGYQSAAESSGGYRISAAASTLGIDESGGTSLHGGYEGSTSQLSGAIATAAASETENVEMEPPRGMPLGRDNLYDHL